MIPEAVDEFRQRLNQALPNALVEFDAPSSDSGTWWIDVSLSDFRTSLSWSAGFGFGVFTSEEGYGDKPDERYQSPHLAERRIVQMVGSLERPDASAAMWLRDVRTLIGVQQMLLADRLEVNQAAISRLENRQDLKLSTLLAYIEALGGKVEMRVRFDDFEAGIALPEPQFSEAS